MVLWSSLSRQTCSQFTEFSCRNILLSDIVMNKDNDNQGNEELCSSNGNTKSQRPSNSSDH